MDPLPASGSTIRSVGFGAAGLRDLGDTSPDLVAALVGLASFGSFGALDPLEALEGAEAMGGLAGLVALSFNPAFAVGFGAFAVGFGAVAELFGAVAGLDFTTFAAFVSFPPFVAKAGFTIFVVAFVPVVAFVDLLCAEESLADFTFLFLLGIALCARSCCSSMGGVGLQDSTLRYRVKLRGSVYESLL